MAMRRRIKVAVNLTSSRKPKIEPPDHLTGAPVLVKVEPVESTSDIEKEQISETCFRPNIIPKTEQQNEQTSDKDAFKCPAKVEFSRSNSYSTASDDTQHNDIDNGVQVIQMDLQQTAMTTPKSQRQRIKATPVFGQRRNSLVGPPTSPLTSDDVEEGAHTPRRERHYSGSQSSTAESISAPNNTTARIRTESNSSQKRERHYSGSQNTGTLSHFTPTKTIGRVRTESTCSVFSDSHLSTISKSRKTEDHNLQRLSMRREYEARFSNGIPDKSALKMSDLIYYNPLTNPMEQKPKITEIKAEAQEPEPETEKTEKDNSAVPVPQLKLNAKGELILDDKSLEIETTAEQEARKVLAKSSLIFLDENTGMNGFYKRHKRTRDWPPEETIRFYRCLQTIGTDFSMMCQLFPKRTRRDLKLKFKKEERCNSALINKALLHPNSFNIEDLKDQFEVEDRERAEEEKEKQTAKEQEKLAKKEHKKIHVKTSKSARALKNAQDVYKYAEGDLVDEPAKKKTKAPQKKTENQTDTKNSDVVTDNKKLTRKPRKPKPKINNESGPPNLSTEYVETTMKMEPEEIIEDVYVISSLENENNSITPYAIQQQFSMLVGDELGEEQQQQSDLEDENVLHQYSTDDDTPQMFVNLDSGNLTQISKKEKPIVDLAAQRAAYLCNNILYGAEYSESSASCNEDYENDTMNNYDKEITETFDKKPPNVKDNTTSYVKKEICDKETAIVTEKAAHISNETSLAVLPASARTHSIQIDNEMAIQQILEDIASGTLQVVSSYDPDTPDETITEIFMVDSKTGDLCDEPLDLPNELVQSILSVMM